MNDRTPLRSRNPTSLAVYFAQLRAEEIGREIRALCGKLALVNEGERFVACADVLLEARRLEANRLANELAGHSVAQMRCWSDASPLRVPSTHAGLHAATAEPPHKAD